ncbi:MULTISPECIES: 4-hydroxyproline epimerase [unclassified Sphingobacterium]|uniref:4-hydroxyproline epimerase n=1 Tax=unclassified Sphingobacterium TaxID=2609468 RepID=UPI0010483D6B|nr:MULTISPECIES: 4-hydroxyproline epimerase [unclassified Sphingobacterium]MCS3553523.1 4-hydroxyproline epimerase [Sphingobacterium sp. JUb21]TCR09267.1 proline racemase [Sphingobacterium sp. JUb20]
MKKTFFCIDSHTCGCPVRLVAGGGPVLRGNSMMERRLHFMEEYDWIRKGLMFEPRGHDMMSGSILYPPTDPNNDTAVLYIETSGCLPMCGHGTIGTVTLAIEEGLVIPKVPGKLRLETPAGLILIDYVQEGPKVKTVKLTNVKSFLYKEALTVQCPDLGEIVADVAYGGNFYAIIDPQKNFKDISDFSASQLIHYGKIIRRLLNEKTDFIHPEDENIYGLSHIQWTGKPTKENSTGRNAVLVGENALDRSPCGTGTSARMAQWYAKGKLSRGEEFVHESYIGSQFVGRIEEETKTISGQPAIIPSVEGWARITGYSQIIIDDEDPYKEGFQVM